MLRHLIGKLGKSLAAMGLVLGVGVGTASADFVYGVDDSGHVWSVNTLNGSKSQLTTLPTGSGANGLAFDSANKTLYFRLPQNGQMYRYVLGSGSNASTVTMGASVPTVTDSSSASFYGSSYYFVNQGTNELYAADMSAVTPTFAKIATFIDANGDPLDGLNFGDIAIDKNGELYMSTYTGFYKADLNSISGGGTLVADLLSSNNQAATLQLAFETGNTLIGQDHNDGKWYEVSTADGSRTLLSGLPNTPMFRDLAGSTAPEPASLVMMGLGAAAALGFARRRVKAHA